MRIAARAGLVLIVSVGVGACRQPNPDWMGPNDSSQDASSGEEATTNEPQTSTTSNDASGTAGTAGSGTGSECPDPAEQVCSGQCVDTMTDRKHCGECGNMCTGNVDCVDGVCQ